MSDYTSIDQYRAQQRNEMRKASLQEAQRIMGEHGVFTLSLAVDDKRQLRRQCFASMNAVDTNTAKWVAGIWLRAKYGVCTIEFRQTKSERIISTEDRVYFHAVITEIKGFLDDEGNDQ